MNYTVRKSSIQGSGVFAARDFTSGELIGSAKGEVVGPFGALMAFARRRERYSDVMQVSPWRWSLPLDNDLGRYVNHSCAPTAAVVRGLDVVALADLPCGEEITIDYATTMWPTIATRVWRMRCSCGHIGCRKRIGHLFTLPPDVFERFVGGRLLPGYMLERLDRRRRR